MRQHALFTLTFAVAAACTAAKLEHATTTRALLTLPIALTIDLGDSAALEWPVTVGIPFEKGALFAGQLAQHRIERNGVGIAAQLDVGAQHDDGSIQWLHASFNADRTGSYAFDSGTPPSSPSISIIDQSGSLEIRTGAACFVFATATTGFPSVSLAVSGSCQSPINIIQQSGAQFVATDLGNDPGTFIAETRTVERTGNHTAIVKITGNYKDNVTSSRIAAATIYFRFFYGQSKFRVDHKLIVTSEQQDGFRNVALEWLPATAPTQATFGPNSASQTRVVTLSAAGPTRATQVSYPQFKKTSSVCQYFDNGSNATTADRCGDWMLVTDNTHRGVGVQVPRFAKAFPMSFETTVGAKTSVKLYSTDDGANALNFATADLVSNVFGSDWITSASSIDNLVNFPSGLARTHELWIYPLNGAINTAETFGATTSKIVGYANAQYLLESGGLGGRYGIPGAAQRTTITDYYERHVLVNLNVFPWTGFLFEGMHPYAASQLLFDPVAARWAPRYDASAPNDPERVGNAFEYDLRRLIWIVWAMTQDRRFLDFATANARHFHDVFFSNFNYGKKQLGWYMQGVENSPMVWGSYGSSANFGTPPTRGINDKSPTLAAYSSSDVAQFAYAYHLMGDHHARDMLEAYRSALEIFSVGGTLDADKTLDEDINRPDALIRMLAGFLLYRSDPEVADFGSALISRLRPNDPTFDNFLITTTQSNDTPPIEAINSFSDKTSEIITPIILFYEITGDSSAYDVLKHYAKFAVRHRDEEALTTRRQGALQHAAAILGIEASDKSAAHLATSFYQRFALLGDKLATLPITNAEGYTQTTPHDWHPASLSGNQSRVLGMAATAYAINRGYPGFALTQGYVATLMPSNVNLLFVADNDERELDVAIDQDGIEEEDAVLERLDAGLTGESIDTEEYSSNLLDHADHSSLWHSLTGRHASIRVSMSGLVTGGTYRVSFGPGRSMRVLDSGGAYTLEATDGLSLLGGLDYTFDVEDIGTVGFRAYRALEIYDPSGTLLTTSPDGIGRWTFYAADPGPHRVRSVHDQYSHWDVANENFIRFHDPTLNVFTIDGSPVIHPPSMTPSRDCLYGPTLTSTHALVLGTDACGNKAISGRAFRANNYATIATVPPTAPSFPFASGTVEFWYRPNWASSTLPLWTNAGASGFGDSINKIFQAGQMTLSFKVESDSEGRTGRAPSSRVHFSAAGQAYQIRHWFEQGRWYHVAVSWVIGGGATEYRIFVDGVRRSFDNTGGVSFPNPAVGVPSTLSASTIFFGTDPTPSGRAVLVGNTFDEMRVYRGRCYWSTHFTAGGGCSGGDASPATYYSLPFDPPGTSWFEVAGWVPYSVQVQ